jgi:hypothetical protein
MLGVSPDGDIGFEMLGRERIGQLGPDLQMIKLLTIRQKVEEKYPHACPPIIVARLFVRAVLRRVIGRACLDGMEGASGEAFLGAAKG